MELRFGSVGKRGPALRYLVQWGLHARRAGRLTRAGPEPDRLHCRFAVALLARCRDRTRDLAGRCAARTSRSEVSLATHNPTRAASRALPAPPSPPRLHGGPGGPPHPRTRRPQPAWTASPSRPGNTSWACDDARPSSFAVSVHNRETADASTRRSAPVPTLTRRETASTPTTDPAELREALVNGLINGGHLRTPAVIAAFRETKLQAPSLIGNDHHRGRGGQSAWWPGLRAVLLWSIPTGTRWRR